MRCPAPVADPSAPASPRTSAYRSCTSKIATHHERSSMRLFTRRRLIETGLAGTALLALAGCARSDSPAGAPFDDRTYAYRALGAGDREVIAAVAAVMLAGALPADSQRCRAALVRAVR